MKGLSQFALLSIVEFSKSEKRKLSILNDVYVHVISKMLG